MPSFRSLLVVDAEGFSRNRDVDLPDLHTEIRRVVEAACARSGLADIWKSVRFLQSTGDGVLAVLPPDAMVLLIHPFTDHLQQVLAECAPALRTRRLQLRLRVALHVGLVDDEDPVTAGISSATNDVCRLLDSEPLRAALRDSDPDVTYTAVITSTEAFDMFVRSGRAGLEPSRFIQVQATVKQFDRPAYLYAPTPSRRERPEVDRSPDDAEASPETRPAGGISFGGVSVNGDNAQNAVGNQVGGDLRQERS